MKEWGQDNKRWGGGRGRAESGMWGRGWWERLRSRTQKKRPTKTIVPWCHKDLDFYKSLLITSLYSEQKLKQKQEKCNCNK